MIRITVELLPGGQLKGRKKIGQVDISNISELAAVSNYLVEAKDFPSNGEPGQKIDAVVKGFSRSEGWAKLLWLAMAELYNENRGFARFRGPKK